MPKSKRNPPDVSSPTSTGGDGIFFEQHVDAAFLSLLLVRGIPPILTDCQVREVHLQTKHKHWNTDDLLVVGETQTGTLRQLAGQAKRPFTVSREDDDCRKTFADFWKDFRAGTVFHLDRDRFAIITLRATATLLGSLVPLLDCSRAASDAADFFQRLGVKGYLNKKAVTYSQEIRAIIEAAQGDPVSDEDFWTFLRHIHLLSYDLNTSTAQTEAILKSLLAHTAVGLDKRGVADQTWAELLRLVGGSMPHAASFTYDQLPEPLRLAHTPIGEPNHATLQALFDHSTTTLRSIRTTIGNTFHLSRFTLTSRLLELVEENRVVIVTGVPGSGKSAIAKDVFEHLSADHLAFAFRAEEFAEKHLDQAIQQCNVRQNGESLFALLAGQGRKVLLIESVERLLEASVRDAFTDLLALIREDPTWRVVMTCRDYSLDLVQSSFLQRVALSCAVLPVPPLSDEELDAVIKAIPELSRPLANARLRGVLRNPYFLDKAAWMPWPDDAPLPQDERAFRKKFWRDVVRADHEAAQGLPRLREQVFIELALRRARALVPYVPCDDCDSAVLDRLRNSGLLAHPVSTDRLMTPSHDVLEDWALLVWIDELFARHGRQPVTFASELGTFPAVRRAFRRWLGEALECTPAELDTFVLAILNTAALPAQFRDDTLVCLLLSVNAAAFIARNEPQLLAHDCALLRRVIHLLRVACKRPPDWLATHEVPASFFLVPEGPAWPAVLAIVRRHLSEFLPADTNLLLGLIDDWARSVTWWSPLPDGAPDAAAIGHALLPHLSRYNQQEDRKRALEAIAQIPRAGETEFLSLVERAVARDRDDDVAEDFAAILLDGMGGFAACRDFPDAVIQLAGSRYFLTETDDPGERLAFSELEMEQYFGLRRRSAFEHSLASAFLGPFSQLLQYHPRSAIAFIIRLLNHSTDWYAQHPDPRGIVESPWAIALNLPDGAVVRQWVNPRLWYLYRGISVGPDLLQCALMALERWLLSLCEANSEHVESWLLHILRKSRSGAITAVVASVATAYPRLSGRAGIPLLACRDVVQIDRGRMSQDSRANGMLSFVSEIQPRSRIYVDERRKANALPHRRYDLETLALNLQLGPHADEVRTVLEQHRNALPPVDQQTDDDRLWRLALHRMDLHAYDVHSPQEEPSGEEEPPQSLDHNAPKTSQVELMPKAPDADIQAMLDEEAPAQQEWGRTLSLFTWATAVFRGDQEGFADPEKWRDELNEARSLASTSSQDPDATTTRMFRDGPKFTAAIAVRDHWDALADDERNWCLDIIAEAVERDCDTEDEVLVVSRGGLDGACPAAYVVPLILTKELPPAQRDRYVHSLALGLTHAIREVVLYTAEGIGRHLGNANDDLTIASAGALALQASAFDLFWQQNPIRRFSERRSRPDWQRDIVSQIRSRFPISRTQAEHALEEMDLDQHYASWTLAHILPVLRQMPSVPSARAFFSRVAILIRTWWDSSRSRNDRAFNRPFEIEQTCLDYLCHFLLDLPTQEALAISQPLIDAMESEPHEASRFIRQLVSTEDKVGKKSSFWPLWAAIADSIADSYWVQTLASRHSVGTELIRNLFLGLTWKEDVRSWHSVDGYSDRVDSLYERLPRCAAVLEAYLYYLYHIGELSLPHAFCIIARSLQEGDTKAMLADSNVRFYVESLLQRFVYTNPAKLKSDPHVRDSVLQLLDQMIEAGSSVAYRMRDDFITPASLNG